MRKCFQNNSFQTPLCSVHTIISCKKDTPIPDTAAKGVDMPHTNRPYKSSYRYRRYCRFPRNSSSFLLCASIIAFLRCRFGKETSAAQYPPVRNLEAFPFLRYNNVAVSYRRNMMKNRQRQKDILFSILIFGSAFAVNLLIQKLFTTSDAGAPIDSLRSAYF